VRVPPVARSLMCSALMPNCKCVQARTHQTPTSLHFSYTSCAASIAAYGDDSSRSAFTFMPPVTRAIVSRPTKVIIIEIKYFEKNYAVKIFRQRVFQLLALRYTIQIHTILLIIKIYKSLRTTCRTRVADKPQLLTDV
jgi:hypothetical protein